MNETETTTSSPAASSPAARWTGWILSGLITAFLLFDAIGKILYTATNAAAAGKMGYSKAEIIGIGIALLTSTILYILPRTAFWGVALLTAYLGGAVDAMVHSGLAGGIGFPVAVGILVWISLGLRDPRRRVWLQKLFC